MMRSAALAVAILIAVAGPASADPADPNGPDIQPVVGVEAAPPADNVEAAPPADNVEAAPPADDGKVASTPPVTEKSPDGWIMTVGGQNEVQLPVSPLTTAISTREYQVSGTFTGSLKGPGGGQAKGVLEVGYQIGCGIEMTTGNGVIVSENVGGAAGLGVGFVPGKGDREIPSVGASIGGGVAVSLKPGLVNIVPLTRKTFVGTAPWVGIHKFRIKIDGCVGQSFIRSYATLDKSNDDGDGILSWYGSTKTI